jgi:hypothetical protein
MKSHLSEKKDLCEIVRIIDQELKLIRTKGDHAMTMAYLVDSEEQEGDDEAGKEQHPCSGYKSLDAKNKNKEKCTKMTDGYLWLAGNEPKPPRQPKKKKKKNQNENTSALEQGSEEEKVCGGPKMFFCKASHLTRYLLVGLGRGSTEKKQHDVRT